VAFNTTNVQEHLGDKPPIDKITGQPEKSGEVKDETNEGENGV
jgi:hypothetical protein